MKPEHRLDERVLDAVRAYADRPAVEDPARGKTVSYRQLDDLSAGIATALSRFGVGEGDRIGIWASKSIGSIASALAALRLGAAYVPVDASGPVDRARYILEDCGVRATICPPDLAPDGSSVQVDAAPLAVEDSCGVSLSAVPSNRGSGAVSTPELAYVLYTSGSTGLPKGVMHTHGSALAFVDWCRERFRPRVDDRFASHAPLHFDLSIHDIWLPLTTGAAIVLVTEADGKRPTALADLVSGAGITIWYSTPSILRLMLEYGKLEDRPCPELRIVHFAGEVFPVKHLRALKAIWRAPRFFNLYGPTETNVCTFYSVPAEVDARRTAPYPIGVPCSGARCRVVDAQGMDVALGDVGELLVSGPSVMQGYWNLPDRTQAAFLVDASGDRWYRTGDMVRESVDVGYLFQGRRDRMVKRRGYRVELGEIEAGLYRHPDVSEVAVTAVDSEEHGVRIRAFVAWSGAGKPSTLAMKAFSAQQLLPYMIPDTFSFVSELPKTSTDKVDYQSLGASP